MGELLPWRRNERFPLFSNRVPDTAGERPLTVGLATQVLELGTGGSLAGATEPEIQARALEANPMRRVATWSCLDCKHIWTAPAASACPRCHVAGPELQDEHINMAQRLK